MALMTVAAASVSVPGFRAMAATVEIDISGINALFFAFGIAGTILGLIGLKKTIDIEPSEPQL
ncbi:MAG: hypothetical protein DI589_23310 [Shinella sp.]|nr:MAG: hypothetical protein DI589_23310 [Shinella sp.]